MVKKKMTKKQFSPTQHIKEHPHTQKTVNAVKKAIIRHIKSSYKKGVSPKYKDWYLGVSKDPENDRTKSHKTEKKISFLANFRSFYAYSLGNARQVEIELCKEFKLKNCSVIGGLKKDSNYVYAYNLKLSK